MKCSGTCILDSRKCWADLGVRFKCFLEKRAGVLLEAVCFQRSDKVLSCQSWTVLCASVQLARPRWQITGRQQRTTNSNQGGRDVAVENCLSVQIESNSDANRI